MPRRRTASAAVVTNPVATGAGRGAVTAAVGTGAVAGVVIIGTEAVTAVAVVIIERMDIAVVVVAGMKAIVVMGAVVETAMRIEMGNVVLMTLTAPRMETGTAT